MTEEIKQKAMQEMNTRYPDGGVDAARTTFFRGCEYGYSLASSEIEALKKEVEKIKALFETEYKAFGAIYFEKHGFDIESARVKAGEAWVLFKAKNNL